MTFGNHEGAAEPASGRSIDDQLRALTVHDLSQDRADRTRALCVARLAGSRAPGRRIRRTVAGPGASPVGWLEPVAALGASLLYLAVAVQAATVLMSLSPMP